MGSSGRTARAFDHRVVSPARFEGFRTAAPRIAGAGVESESKWGCPQTKGLILFVQDVGFRETRNMLELLESGN